MDLTQILVKAHSGLRWLVLFALVAAIVNAVTNTSNNQPNKKNGIALIALISSHIQLVIGIVLLFLSEKVSFESGWMKNAVTRFFGMEHVLMMIIAVVLITIGYSKSKKQRTLGAANKKIQLFYIIGLLVILAAIPWPFRENLGAAWF